MDSTPLLLSALRGVHVAALLSVLGCLVSAAGITQPETVRTSEAAALSWRLGRISAALGLMLGFLWLVIEAAVMAGVQRPAAVVGALPTVVLHSQFGWFLSLRLCALCLVLLLPHKRTGSFAALLLAVLAIAVQPLLSHAGAASGNLRIALTAGEIVHLLAAGAWLGGLLPLWIAVRILSCTDAAATCGRFSVIGIAAVVLIAAGGIILGAGLIGSICALIGSWYGRLVLVKSGLFLAALSLAALNRFWLTGRLAAGQRSPLLISIAFEGGFGLAAVLVAAVLAEQMPGMDM